MSPLYPGESSHAWHHLPWTAFQATSDRQPTLAIQPIYALIERGADVPFDQEERWIMNSLSFALKIKNSETHQSLSPSSGAEGWSLNSIRVLPPFRHVPELLPHQIFGTGLPEASQALIEIAASVREAGLKKIAFVHLNEAMGDWIDTLARQIRIELGLQAFNLNLQGMGIAETVIHTPPQEALIETAADQLEGFLSQVLEFPPPTQQEPKDPGHG